MRHARPTFCDSTRRLSRSSYYRLARSASALIRIGPQSRTSRSGVRDMRQGVVVCEWRRMRCERVSVVVGDESTARAIGCTATKAAECPSMRYSPRRTLAVSRIDDRSARGRAIHESAMGRDGPDRSARRVRPKIGIQAMDVEPARDGRDAGRTRGGAATTSLARHVVPAPCLRAGGDHTRCRTCDADASPRRGCSAAVRPVSPSHLRACHATMCSSPRLVARTTTAYARERRAV